MSTENLRAVVRALKIELYSVVRLSHRPDLDPAEISARMPNHWSVVLRRGDRTLHSFYSGGAAVKTPTDATDVLGGLARDAAGADQDFEGWASDLGLSTDSRAAERTYHACRASAMEMRRFLGDHFERVLAAEW